MSFRHVCKEIIVTLSYNDAYMLFEVFSVSMFVSDWGVLHELATAAGLAEWGLCGFSFS